MFSTNDYVNTVTLSGQNIGTGIGEVDFASGANLPDDGADTWVGGSYMGLNGSNVFTAAVGKITASNGNRLTCTDLSYYWRSNPTAVTNVGAGSGYVINHLRALDSAMEWYSANDGTLYFFPPSGINLSTTPVDVRTRLWGVDLSNRTGITLEGLHLFAASVLMKDSVSCVMRCCEVEYPAPWSNYYHGVPAVTTGSGANQGTGGSNYGGYEDGSSGVFLSGSNNVVENCWIHKSWGAGVRLEGFDNTVTGSLVENIGWMMRRHQPIQAFGTRSQVIGNTVRNCSQSAIDGGNRLLGGVISSNITVTNNVIERPALVLHDTGAFYINHQGQSANGTEFAYNVIKDNTTSLPYGFYGDNGTDDMTVHHNLMVIPQAWMGVRFNGSRNVVFNNTILQPDNSIIHQRSGLTGQRVHNNLGNRKIRSDGSSAVVSNNVTNVPNSQFVNTNDGDYRIKTTYSQAVDQGILIAPHVSGYTDDFIGATPDLGCYEAAQPIWNAGSWVNANITAAVGTLLTEKPTDPIELNADTGNILADFSIIQGGMGAIPVTLNNVPAIYNPALYLDFNGTVSSLVGAQGTDIGAGDYAFTTTTNADGTLNYAFQIQRSTILLSEEWRIIIDSNFNDAPIFNLGAEYIAIEGIPFSGSLSATDPDLGDTLNYSLISGPAWLTVAADGTLSGTADVCGLGIHSFTVSVQDDAGLSDTAILQLYVLEASALLYEDNFSDGALGANPNTGGGMGNFGTDNGDRWQDSNGELFYVSDGSGGNRASAHSLNSFDLSEGFRLEVQYHLGSLAVSANNQFSFGLIRGYVPSQNNRLLNAGSGTYGMGFTLATGTNGAATGLLIHDEAGVSPNALNLANGFTPTTGSPQTLVLTMVPTITGGADWSYSFGGSPVATGTIGTIDLASQPYQFVAHARDVTIGKSIQSIRLTKAPQNATGPTYANWAACHNLAGANAAANADSDDDGLPNAIEAYFGTDPNAFTQGPCIESVDDATSILTYSINTNAPSDLTVSYQWSQNLADWFACDGVETSPSGGTVTATPLASGGVMNVNLVSNAPMTKLFFRVAVD